MLGLKWILRETSVAAQHLFVVVLLSTSNDLKRLLILGHPGHDKLRVWQLTAGHEHVSPRHSLRPEVQHILNLSVSVQLVHAQQFGVFAAVHFDIAIEKPDSVGTRPVTAAQ